MLPLWFLGKRAATTISHAKTTVYFDPWLQLPFPKRCQQLIEILVIARAWIEIRIDEHQRVSLCQYPREQAQVRGRSAWNGLRARVLPPIGSRQLLDRRNPRVLGKWRCHFRGVADNHAGQRFHARCGEGLKAPSRRISGSTGPASRTATEPIPCRELSEKLTRQSVKPRFAEAKPTPRAITQIADQRLVQQR